jgi:hypothetical protein
MANMKLSSTKNSLSFRIATSQVSLRRERLRGVKPSESFAPRGVA